MRQIDWEKPLSEEDQQWVEQFGTQAMRRRMERQQQRFTSVEQTMSDEDSSDQEPQDNYDDMTLDQLKVEAKARKEDNPDFDTSGIKTKGDLIERLRQWDSDHAEEEQ